MSIDNLPPVPAGYDINKLVNMETPHHPELEQPEAPVDVPQPEVVDEIANAVPIEQEPVQETKKEMNLRIMRERMEKAERERDDLLRSYQNQQYAPQQQTPQYAQQNDWSGNIEIAEGDLAEAKHVKQLEAKTKYLEQMLNLQAQNNDETRIRMQHPDFDKVVNKDNLAMLKQGFPPLYESIMANSNLYSKGSAAYTMIKSLGISLEEAQTNERDVMAKNLAKPKSINTVTPQRGDTPLTQANAFASGLTPDLQKKLWQETQKAMRSKNVAY